MVTEQQVRDALADVFDPELRLDIITLGLVYKIMITEGRVHVQMTFTTPMCPYGPNLVEDVKQHLEKIPGVTSTEVEIVFDPPWQPTEEVKAMLGMN